MVPPTLVLLVLRGGVSERHRSRGDTSRVADRGDGYVLRLRVETDSRLEGLSGRDSYLDPYRVSPRTRITDAVDGGRGDYLAPSLVRLEECIRSSPSVEYRIESHWHRGAGDARPGNRKGDGPRGDDATVLTRDLCLDEDHVTSDEAVLGNSER